MGYWFSGLFRNPAMASQIWCVSAKASHNDKNTSKVCHCVLPFERLLKIIPSTPVAVQDIAHLGHRFDREERQWIIFSTFYSEQKHMTNI